MQTAIFEQQTIETHRPTSEYVVDQPIVAEQFAREMHVEEDGVDWCAWWAEYAEALE